MQRTAVVVGNTRSVSHSFIRPFDEISSADVALGGGKNASLGEMVRELKGRGVRVADGFAVTAEAFRYFLREAALDGRIRTLLAGLDVRDVADLSRRGPR